MQPIAGAHTSTVQYTPSSQVTAWPVHAPPVQLSPLVQTLPSSHTLASGKCWQPMVSMHESAVHGLPSLHALAVPSQVPPLQVSCSVQTSPSVQGSLLKGPWQPPPWHWSGPVQSLPSSHRALLPAYRQPWLGSQLSSVHGFLSSQPTACPLQAPPLHVSALVQKSPSSHGPVASGCTQPTLGSHTSLVQALLSLQAAAVGTPLLFMGLSTVPSQSSSSPLHTSACGVPGWHGPNTAVAQVRVPAQVGLVALPTVAMQVVCLAAAMASGVQPQTCDLGRHCLALPPSRNTASLHAKSGGQSLSALQPGAQNQPPLPVPSGAAQRALLSWGSLQLALLRHGSQAGTHLAKQTGDKVLPLALVQVPQTKPPWHSPLLQGAMHTLPARVGTQALVSGHWSSLVQAQPMPPGHGVEVSISAAISGGASALLSGRARNDTSSVASAMPTEVAGPSLEQAAAPSRIAVRAQ